MSRFPCPLVVAPMFLGLLFVGSGLAAETRPAEDQDWFRDQPMRPPGVQAGGAAGRDFGQPVGPPPGPSTAAPPGAYGGNDFPDDEVHDWVVASARAAHFRAMFHRAEKELTDSVRDAQWSFEQSKEYREASAAEKQAYDAYTAERQRALQSVLSDPKYKAALDLRDQLGDQIMHYRAMAKPADIPRDQLLALASQKLQYASEAHAMEIAALDKDEAIHDARQKMVHANSRTSELRAQFDASIRVNPQVLQARRNLEDARVALITAEAYRDAAGAAGSIATDYAYYRHKWDFTHQNNELWGPYGYRY